MPRYLTNIEIADFLVRHPIIAGWITETEAIMQAGLYDYNYDPATQWRLPGVIPPWGIQQEDNKYGLVTVFPAQDGTWRYTGFNDVNLHIDDPDYVSPSGGSILDDLANQLGNIGTGLGVVIGLGALYFLWPMLSKKRG